MVAELAKRKRLEPEFRTYRTQSSGLGAPSRHTLYGHILMQFAPSPGVPIEASPTNGRPEGAADRVRTGVPGPSARSDEKGIRVCRGYEPEGRRGLLPPRIAKPGR